MAMIAAARQRLEIYDYTGRLMRALGNPPDRVRHTLGRTVGPIRRAPGRAPARGRGVRPGVKATSPRTRVILPMHFERHTLPPKGRASRLTRRR